MKICTFGCRIRIHIHITGKTGSEIGNFRIVRSIFCPHKEIRHGYTDAEGPLQNYLRIVLNE